MLSKINTCHLVMLCCIMLTMCSRSGHRSPSMNGQNMITQQNPVTEVPIEIDSEKNVLKMRTEGGVRIVAVEINDIKLDFIFDTGAGDIGISMAEAIVLIRQGTLSEEDVLGVQQYQIANGEIVEGTVINLRKVKLGNRILYNVRASVIDNPHAPLLLGQSALEQFGKITIDNVRNEIILE